MPNLPDGNNVYGLLTALSGLASVRDAIVGVDGVEKATLKVSAYSRAESLRFSGDFIDFESEHLGDGQHLLNGGVAGTLDEVITFVVRLSRALSEAGIGHSLEVYNEAGELVRSVTGPG